VSAKREKRIRKSAYSCPAGRGGYCGDASPSASPSSFLFPDRRHSRRHYFLFCFEDAPRLRHSVACAAAWSLLTSTMLGVLDRLVSSMDTHAILTRAARSPLLPILRCRLMRHK
jgi:hypothetical protein